MTATCRMGCNSQRVWAVWVAEYPANACDILVIDLLKMQPPKPISGLILTHMLYREAKRNNFKGAKSDFHGVDSRSSCQGGEVALFHLHQLCRTRNDTIPYVYHEHF